MVVMGIRRGCLGESRLCACSVAIPRRFRHIPIRSVRLIGLPRGIVFAHSDANGAAQAGLTHCTAGGRQRAKEMKMPKLKTKSGAAKRFKITGSGKVLYAQRGKRHGMIKRTKKQIRNLRGTAVLFKSDGDNIKKYFLPNG